MFCFVLCCFVSFRFLGSGHQFCEQSCMDAEKRAISEISSCPTQKYGFSGIFISTLLTLGCLDFCGVCDALESQILENTFIGKFVKHHQNKITPFPNKLLLTTACCTHIQFHPNRSKKCPLAACIRVDQPPVQLAPPGQDAGYRSGVTQCGASTDYQVITHKTGMI